MSATMLRAAFLVAAATCVVGVRKNKNHAADAQADGLEGVEQVSEGLPADKWCTLEEHTLSCGEGQVIEIIKAQYSRQRTAECNPPMATTSAKCDVTVTEELAATCNNEQECTVPASFHSTCPDYPFSFIRVRFECVEGVASRTDRKEAWDFEKLPNDEMRPEQPEGLTTLPVTTTGPTGAAPLRRYSKFTVWIQTSNKMWAGTDDTIYVKLSGEGGNSGWNKLDYLFQNDFERGSLQVYSVASATPIAITSVCLMKKKVGWWNDSWRPAMVKVYEDETQSQSPKMIGSASGWGVFEDENAVCMPLHNS